MRRNGLSPNRIGTVENRKRRTALSVGVSRDARNIPSRDSVVRLVPGNKSAFGAFWGFGQKALRRGTRVFRAEGYCAAYAHTGMSADESTAPFCLMPGSHRLLFAHKRRQKALFPTHVLAASEIARRQFRRRGLG